MLRTFAPFFFSKKTRTLKGMSFNEAKFPSDPLCVFGAEVFKGINIRDVPKKILVTSFLLDNGLEDDNRSWEAR